MDKGKISRSQALLTAIGFMIGSGIFFRADNISEATQGNVLIATLAWLFIGSTLIFAGISVAVIASDADTDGGFIGYIDHYFCKWFGDKVGKNLAFIMGWYQIVVYTPMFVAVVSTVFAEYFLKLFGVEMTITNQYATALALIIFMFVWNALSTKIAAMISSTATIVKLIPLVLLAIAGIVFGEPAHYSTSVVPELVTEPKSTFALFYAPMLSMAFAFDGWISVGALSKDMDNPKKNLPFVFTWSVIITAVIYTAYYVGVSMLMPAAEIVAEGNTHVSTIANMLGGKFFDKLIVTCVAVSVLGTANGIFMAGTRYTHRLASQNDLINSKFFKKESKYGTPINASIFMLVVILMYLGLYFAQANYIAQSADIIAAGGNFITNVVLDDIPMALNSIFYFFVFYITFRLYKEGKCSKVQGIVAPIIACLGQGIIVFAFFGNNGSYAWGYLGISAVVIALGYVNYFYNKRKA